MVKHIDTLVEDIQGLFEGHGFSDALGRFSEDLGKSFQERFKEYASERKPSLRLSNYGKPLRQLWYELSGRQSEPLSPSTKFKFLYGDVLEGLLLLLAAEAGHTVTDMQREVSVDGVTGHIDAIIDGTTVVDVKSASTYSFNKFRTGGLRLDDPFGYIPQLAGYSCALGGLNGAFLVVDKTLGHIHLEKFDKKELQSYAPIRRIATVREALARPDEPERCYAPVPDGKSGNLRLGIGCSYCGHKTHCWRDSNDGHGLRTFLYSSGPTYLVKTVKEPRVEEQR